MPTKGNRHSCSLDAAIKAEALNGYFFSLNCTVCSGGMAFTSAVNSKQAWLDVRKGGETCQDISTWTRSVLCATSNQTPTPSAHNRHVHYCSNIKIGKLQRIQFFQRRTFGPRKLNFNIFFKALVPWRSLEILIGYFAARMLPSIWNNSFIWAESKPRNE